MAYFLCEYWTKPEDSSHVKEMSYKFLQIHGCMYGLKSIARVTRGLPIAKPWTIATYCPTSATYLSKRCRTQWHTNPVSGNTTLHASCSGVNTKITEGYTDEMAVAVHNGHKDNAYGSTTLLRAAPFPSMHECIQSLSQGRYHKAFSIQKRVLLATLC